MFLSIRLVIPFTVATDHKLTIVRIEYVCSEDAYNKIKEAFDKEKSKTDLKYSFPKGAGDCNCATFPARIGLPIPSTNGRMQLYMEAMEKAPKVRYLGVMPELGSS